jgi:hypothetical protein
VFCFLECCYHILEEDWCISNFWHSYMCVCVYTRTHMRTWCGWVCTHVCMHVACACAVCLIEWLHIISLQSI